MARHTVYSEVVEIDAPIETVWQVLLDFDSYPEWNPFTKKVETDLVIGNPVNLHVKMPRRINMVQVEYVREVTEPNTLSWGMTMGAEFLLVALREQHLKPLGDNRCSYHTTDAFDGLLTPVVKALFGGPIRDGFNAMAYALKRRAESVEMPPQRAALSLV